MPRRYLAGLTLTREAGCAAAQAPRPGSAGARPPACYLGPVISGSGGLGIGPGGTLGSGDDHPTFDTSVAHQARIYNYWLGRKVEVLHTCNAPVTWADVPSGV